MQSFKPLIADVAKTKSEHKVKWEKPKQIDLSQEHRGDKSKQEIARQ